MRIGIVVYSLSGHTLTVAEKLQQGLAADGHAVSLAQVKTVGPAKSSAEDAALKTRPAIDAYEGLVLCTPSAAGRRRRRWSATWRHCLRCWGDGSEIG